ncbi:hypothetical protein BC629DRAFT_1502302 [Irpex lacteus]|nr:hypothetical protein BC629DRAFT_1502302 [Irpex lacteus]
MFALLYFQMIAVLVAAVQAFAWPSRQSSPVNKHVDNTVAENNIWRSGELSTLLDNHDKLESYTRKPDCFRRVANSIRVQCGDLDMDEDERVRAAISMTICELATAKHTPPLECTSVVPLADSSSVGSEAGGPDRCVEALSRSAQYWSSYSGYLREIPQLCHAFRRWNDIDMAKDVYRNASLEAISILRALNDAEKRQRSFYEGIDEINQNLRDFMHEMSKTHVEMGESASGVLHKMQSENKQAVVVLRHTLSSALELHSEGHRSLLQELENKMQDITERHSHALDLLAPNIRTVLESQLGHMLDETWRRVQDLNTDALTAQDNWRAVVVEFGHTQEAIAALTSTVTDATSVLDSHVDQAVLASRIQAETTDAAGRLGEALTNMITYTYAEMEKINDTATAVHSQWLAAGSTHSFVDWRHWSDQVLYTTQWLLQVLFRVDSTVVDHMLGSRVLTFAGLSFRVLWYIICTGLTSLTSILLLFASCNGRVFSKAKAPLNEETLCATYPEAQEKPIPRPNARLVVSRSLVSRSQAGSLSGRSQGSFSRIPDRLCRPPTE